MEFNEKNSILLGLSALMAASMLSLVLTANLLVFVSVLIIGVVVIVVSFSILQFAEYSRLKNCEDEFPSFLRDLAEAKRSGMSLVQSLQTCARSDYGALTQEIVKIRNQLSWNIPMKIVFENFRKRFSKSSIINHSILIIVQMEESGGKTEDIIESLADNIENIKETQAEKKVLMSQHIMSMYAIFFIFFGISIALIKFLMPFIDIQGESSASYGLGDLGGMIGLAGGSPCKICINSYEFECISCHVYFGMCSVFGFGDISSAGCYFKSLFFLMIIIQGIFSGLVAGQIGSDSIIVGVKHSMIMTTSGFVLFLVAAYSGMV
jgi:flagellar protein FlaJ